MPKRNLKSHENLKSFSNFLCGDLVLMCKSLWIVNFNKIQTFDFNYNFFCFSLLLAFERQVAMGNNQSTSQRLSQEDIDEINTFASKSPKEIKTYLEKTCNEWQNTKVTIGITGLSHRGKSTFINTVRNIKPGAPGAAAVRNQECTVEAGFYEFPNNKNITLVDLPGVGTDNFPKDEYFERIGIIKYVNYFILIHCVGTIFQVST